MPQVRIPPSERISKEIMEIIQSLSGQESNQKLLGQLMRLSLRKLVQEVLEKEVEEYLGRGYYEHGETRKGYRNGYKPGHLKTAEDRVLIQKPQVADSPETFSSEFWSHIKGRTEQLERIAVEMYARGCSTRDIEELLKDKDGRMLLSKSAVSQLNQRLWEEYEAFCRTDLSGQDVLYLFSDAVYESLRLHKSRKEGILVVWGIVSNGCKVLLGMRLGNKESYDDWLDLFRDLKKRGLGAPILGTTDGAPGLIQAFEEAFPYGASACKSLRQRCLVHKKRNILSKVPSQVAPEMKFHLNSVYFAADEKSALREAQAFRDRFAGLYPSAVKSFEDDLEACLAHLKCPPRHRKFITSTNLVERSFEEEKRRSKVIPRFFDEKSGLKLVFAALIRASQSWRRIVISFDEEINLIELRHKLNQQDRGKHTKSANPRRPQPVDEIFQKK